MSLPFAVETIVSDFHRSAIASCKIRRHPRVDRVKLSDGCWIPRVCLVDGLLARLAPSVTNEFV